jgi:hypothetical protein
LSGDPEMERALAALAIAKREIGLTAEVSVHLYEPDATHRLGWHWPAVSWVLFIRREQGDLGIAQTVRHELAHFATQSQRRRELERTPWPEKLAVRARQHTADEALAERFARFDPAARAALAGIVRAAPPPPPTVTARGKEIRV